MKIISVVGIVLVGLGVVGLIYGGISYTSDKNVVDIGTVHLQVEQKREIPAALFAGAAAVIIGVGLMLVDRRRAAPSKSA